MDQRKKVRRAPKMERRTQPRKEEKSLERMRRRENKKLPKRKEKGPRRRSSVSKYELIQQFPDASRTIDKKKHYYSLV